MDSEQRRHLADDTGLDPDDLGRGEPGEGAAERSERAEHLADDTSQPVDRIDEDRDHPVDRTVTETFPPG
jgi:hypothetical protein